MTTVSFLCIPTFGAEAPSSVLHKVDSSTSPIKRAMTHEPFGSGEGSSRASGADMEALMKGMNALAIATTDGVDAKPVSPCCVLGSVVEAFVMPHLEEWAQTFVGTLLKMVEQDMTDGRFDGKDIDGNSINYAAQISRLLGYDAPKHYQQADRMEGSAKALMGKLKAEAEDHALRDEVLTRTSALATQLLQNGLSADAFLEWSKSILGSYAKNYKRALAPLLVEKFDELMRKELSNGKVDGKDSNGEEVNWPWEIVWVAKQAVSLMLSGAKVSNLIDLR